MDETTIGDLMTEPVLTAEQDNRAVDVAGAMAEAGINSVVVIDESCRPLGILTSTDYVELTADGVNPHETTVSQLMTGSVVTATRDESVIAAAATMDSNNIGHLPVVDDDGQVTGILTGTDLTTFLASKT
jgi:CBS domain-containing protein